jgi:RNA-directed DNA polymerase
MITTKPFSIPKQLVWNAYLKVKANRGSAGIDEVSMQAYEKNLRNNLYQLWNRMSSGSYMPPAVLLVQIPKKSGGWRPLGIPTIADRIAQMVVKMVLEPELDPIFHEDSYGYRPGKSAHDALEKASRRTQTYNWVVDLDIEGFFDNISHDLLLKALRKHTSTRWILLYLERWLKAPMQTKDGTTTDRGMGTPQGSVISPLLANLFLHYCMDEWSTSFSGEVCSC